jgi:predicted ABC-type exoprotein transport system permease subunit
MTVQKNIPDRIKLILQLIVYSLFTWALLFLPVSFILYSLILKVEQGQKINIIPLFIVLTTLTIVIQGGRFIFKWKKLKHKEDAGELPDMQDMRNITPRQMIFLAIGIPLLVISYVLFQFDYKRTGGLMFYCLPGCLGS